MPLFLSGWSPTTCDHTAPRSRSLGSNAAMSAGDGRTIELRIRISRRSGGSARCSGSRARVQPRNFIPHTPPSSMTLGLDQVPESLFPAVACSAYLPLGPVDLLAIVLVFSVGELAMSQLFFAVGLRDRPY